MCSPFRVALKSDPLQEAALNPDTLAKVHSPSTKGCFLSGKRYSCTLRKPKAIPSAVESHLPSTGLLLRQPSFGLGFMSSLI